MRSFLLIALLFASTATAQGHMEKATFAAGCFWCAEDAFEKVDGVVSVISGFTGGGSAAASYKEVSAGGTGHLESVEVTFDPVRVTYRQLLEVFWTNVDPTDDGGQFCDRGHQYLSAIFYRDATQKAEAEASRTRVQELLKKNVATSIVQAGPFFPADASHQDYYKKNPYNYKNYKFHCGRERRLKAIWGKIDLQL